MQPWSLIVWATTINHLLWGLLLLMDSSVSNVTSVSFISSMIGSGNGVFVESFLLIIVALLSVWPCLAKKGRTIELVAAMPQQFVLLMSAWAAISAIASSSFSDGVERPMAFIAADQMIHVLLAIFHAYGILLLHKWKQITNG